MNAQAKEQIMALAETWQGDNYADRVRVYLRAQTREAWAGLTDWQKEQYIREARWLHIFNRMTPAEAVSTVRSMVRIGAWK